MKKLISLLLALFLLSTSALAAPQTIDLDTLSIEELYTMKNDIETRIAAIEDGSAPETSEDDALSLPTEAPTYATLQNGSKGDGVKKLQQRLIDLKYLTGKADGGYGNMSAQAVTDFQKVVGITPSGIADSETQTALFAEDAPENPNPPFDPSAYEKMNYKAIARDPDAYKLKPITFTGKIVQVMEGEDNSTTYRIASKGSYDDVVYVEYTRPEGASRILDDDKVTVYGICAGVISYSSTMGGKITIPACLATKIDLR